MTVDPMALPALALLSAAPCIGSFAALLADRMAEGGRWIAGRSVCDGCGLTLSVRDLIPLASWLLTKGRARCCGAPIRPALPAAEAAALGLTLWAVAASPSTGMAVASSVLAWALLMLALIDRSTMTLPDPLTLPLIPAGLALALAGWTGAPIEHALGAMLGFLCVWGARHLWLRLRGVEGIGLGDAKLLAAAGAWVGFGGLASVMLWACAIGLAQAVASALHGGDWRSPLPFGPALAAGFWLTWMLGPLSPLGLTTVIGR